MGKSKLGTYSALVAASLLSMGGDIPLVNLYERSMLGKGRHKRQKHITEEQAVKLANRNRPDYKKKGVYPKHLRRGKNRWV